MRDFGNSSIQKAAPADWQKSVGAAFCSACAEWLRVYAREHLRELVQVPALLPLDFAKHHAGIFILGSARQRGIEQDGILFGSIAPSKMACGLSNPCFAPSAINPPGKTISAAIALKYALVSASYSGASAAPGRPDARAFRIPPDGAPHPPRGTAACPPLRANGLNFAGTPVIFPAAPLHFRRNAQPFYVVKRMHIHGA